MARVLAEFCGLRWDAAGGVAILPDSRDLVIGSPDGTVQRVSLVTGEPVWLGREKHGPVLQDVTLARGGRLVATAAEDRLVRVWDAVNGDLLVTLPHPASVNQISFSPGDDDLVAACDDGSIHVWRAATDDQVGVFGAHEGWVVSADWSPQDGLIATASNDGMVQVVNAVDGTLVQSWTGGLRPGCVAWSPDGERLAAGWEDGSVVLWRRGAWDKTEQLKGHAGPINCLEWSPDGRLLASGGDDAVVQIQEPATRRDVMEIGFGEPFVWRMCWAPNGGFLAASLCGGMVRLWDVKDV